MCAMSIGVTEWSQLLEFTNKHNKKLTSFMYLYIYIYI